MIGMLIVMSMIAMVSMVSKAASKVVKPVLAMKRCKRPMPLSANPGRRQGD